MLNILKKIFIGVAIGSILFFLKTEVFAATTASFRIRYTDNNTQVDPSYTNAGSSYTFTPSPQGHEFFLKNIFIRFQGYTFQANKTYSINFDFTINDSLAQYWNSWGSGTGYYSNSGVSAISCQGPWTSDTSRSFSCIIRVGSSNVTSLTIGLYPSYYNGSNWVSSQQPLTAGNTYVYSMSTNFTITSSESEVDAINNQTDILNNGIINLTRTVGSSAFELLQQSINNYNRMGLIYSALQANNTSNDLINNKLNLIQSAMATVSNYFETNAGITIYSSDLDTIDSSEFSTAAGQFSSGVNSGKSLNGALDLDFSNFHNSLAYLSVNLEYIYNFFPLLTSYILIILTLGLVGVVLNR